MKLMENGIYYFPEPITELLVQGVTLFGVAMSNRVMPAFYRRARVRFPTQLHCRLCHVGTSSIAGEFLLYDAEVGDVLASGQTAFVFVNTRTQSLHKLPENARKSLLGTVQGNNHKVEILKEFPDPPAERFQMRIRVRHSDIDQRQHANQASFYEFAMEAATEGIRQGHFHTLTGDLFSYPVELVECRNKGQALCGDKLTVSVWESGERPKQIFCQIHKDDTLIWIGTLSFGTPAKL